MRQRKGLNAIWAGVVKYILIQGALLMPTYNVTLSKTTEDKTASEIRSSVIKYGKMFHVEPELLMAIIKTESGGYPLAIRYEPHLSQTAWYLKTLSQEERGDYMSFCSMGVMQILFGVAKDLGFKGGPLDLLRPANSICYGAALFHQKERKYKDRNDAIAAYNQGNNRTKDDGTYQNQSYVDKVLAHYKYYTKRGLIPEAVP